MTNGIISSHDSTKIILRSALNHIQEKHRSDRITWKRHFASLRSTCKFWKDIVDNFVDLFRYADLLDAMAISSIDSVRFLVSRPVELTDDPLFRWKRDEKITTSHATEILRILLTHPRINPSANDNSAVKAAIIRGEFEAVKLIVAHPNFDPTPHTYDDSPLGYAFKRDSTKVIHLLLNDPRADLSARSNEAIRLASSYRRMDILQMLLNNPRVDPSAEDNFAVRRISDFGASEALLMLLNDPRVDPSAGDNEVIRGIAHHIDNDHTAEVVRLLLADPRVDPTTRDNYAIRNASSSGATEMVQLLLADPRVDPSAGDNYAIRNTSYLGRIELVRLLLSHPRVDPSARDNEAIRRISSYMSAELVGLLLNDPRVDPSARDNEAILGACHVGKTEVLRSLLAHPRVDPSARDNEAILIVCKSNDIEKIKLLLAHPRVDPSARDNDAIRTAVRIDVVQLLLSHSKVIPPAGGSEGTAVVQFLLSHPKVDPSSGNNRVVRGILEYSWYPRIETIKLLLDDPRVDPSAENNWAVRKVCHWGFEIQLVQLILAHPLVDPSAEDNEAIQTACSIRIASLNGCTDVMRLLLADPRVDPSAENNEAVRNASKGNHEKVLRMLLDDPRVNPSPDVIAEAVREAYANGQFSERAQPNNGSIFMGRLTDRWREVKSFFENRSQKGRHDTSSPPLQSPSPVVFKKSGTTKQLERLRVEASLDAEYYYVGSTLSCEIKITRLEDGTSVDSPEIVEGDSYEEPGIGWICVSVWGTVNWDSSLIRNEVTPENSITPTNTLEAVRPTTVFSHHPDFQFHPEQLSPSLLNIIDPYCGMADDTEMIFCTPLYFLTGYAPLKCKQSKTYRFQCALPYHVPPSFKGVYVKYRYSASVSVQAHDISADSTTLPVATLTMPFRMINPTSAVQRTDIPHNLRSDFEYDITSRELMNDTSQQKPKLERSHSEVKSPTRLLAECEYSHLLKQVNTAVNGATRPMHMTIQKGGVLLGTLILSQTVLSFGDYLRGILNFSEGGLHCLQVSIRLETVERPTYEENSKTAGHFRTISEQHQLTHNHTNAQFSLQIPHDGPSEMTTDLVSLRWRLSFEFVTSSPGITSAQMLKWNLPIRVLVSHSPPMNIYSTPNVIIGRSCSHIRFERIICVTHQHITLKMSLITRGLVATGLAVGLGYIVAPTFRAAPTFADEDEAPRPRRTVPAQNANGQRPVTQSPRREDEGSRKK
ncbi:hypothetical protein PROFUN_11352 [Planoprotostelium fungivorum]|uniref:Uncharacterized protein n=1 Tax=Planoprotostelium fungivorum TaxID=1890364 RepID=A0A2P6NAD3_9EUKA|nr:hypothetical protein PROFUN_11352 [Planoprotostelium fungivorum]